MIRIPCNDNRDGRTHFVFVARQVEPALFPAPIRIGVARDCARAIRTMRRAGRPALTIAARFPLPSRHLAHGAREAFRYVMAGYALDSDWFELSVEDAVAAMCRNVDAMIRHRFEIGAACDLEALRDTMGVTTAERYLCGRPRSQIATRIA